MDTIDLVEEFGGECAACGEELLESEQTYYDGQRITCRNDDCGALNILAVDEDGVYLSVDGVLCV